MSDLTAHDWQTIREALDSLRYDVEDDPGMYVEGAAAHLDEVTAKLPAVLATSKVFMS